MKDRRGLPSDEYWRERAEDRLTEAEKLSVPYLEDIHAVYDDAKLKIVEDIKNLYKNCYKDDEGFDQEKLRVIIPNGDLERFHREMKKAGLSEYLPDNYKARMTRLEYLYADCWAESKKASLKHQQIETKAHRETIKNAYYKTIYDTGIGLKVNPAFSKLDNRAVNQVLNTKFLGGNYSERIWNNTDKLANTLKEVIGSAIARGESYSKTARGIRERFGVTQYEATRLVQTETCYFQNQAEIEALKTMGIEKYKFIATLDSRTSDICRGHDKKVYNVEDAKAGENLPPLHPNPYQKGTKIWTQNGWISVEDLKEGDLCWTIADEGDEPHLSPVVRTYHYNEPLIEFKNRSLTLRVSPTHNLWAKYRRKDNSGYRFVEAQKIGNDNILYRGIGNKNIKTASDELLAFIAFYAGDGTIHGNYVVICSTEHHDKILPQLSKLGKTTVLSDGRIGLSGGKMADLAREIGTHSTTKRLPRWIMGLSRDSLRKFLDYYALCDGHIKKGKKWKNSQFSDEIVLFTTSEELRDDLIEVALRAGFKPSLKMQKPRVSVKKDGTVIKANHPCFTISLGHHLHTFTGNLTRTMLPKQDCYCVELADTHTLLVMTEGKIVWCGNCRSTVSAYLGEEYESAIRVARNEDGENEYVDNVSYDKWLKRIENGTLRREPVAVKPDITSSVIDTGDASAILSNTTTKTTEQKGYIGGRKHLIPVIKQMEEYDGITRKISQIYKKDEIKEVFLGYPTKKTAALFNVSKKTKIFFIKKYALHMDNSGHFTGKGYGPHGHSDKKPLSMKELSTAISIIKTAKKDEVIKGDVVRKAQRYFIVRKTTSLQLINVEVAINNNGRMNIVSIYNTTNKYVDKLRQKYEQ